MPYPAPIIAKLTAIYEDLIWLSRRPHVTQARARAWYSAVWSEALKRNVRLFSGRVSRAALEDINGTLCLEHYKRLSASLTDLLKKHSSNNHPYSPEEFIKLIEDCERVNITTAKENRNVQTKNGNYADAGIELVEWVSIPREDQILLWKCWLKNKVSNAAEYAPERDA
jgi:hypothetical protein